MPCIGISPDEEGGVGMVEDGVRDDGVRDEVDLSSPPRRRDLVAGESCGARCDLRLCRSIMLTAQASMSTGVRLAAWRKGSASCEVC